MTDKIINSDLEDMFDTDSEGSTSSSSIDKGHGFKPINPYVLELHNIQNNRDPAMMPDNKRKKRKKRRVDKEERDSENSSSSLSEVSMPPRGLETTNEEFYDAHESFHALPENQVPSVVAPAATAALALAHTQEEQIPKVAEPAAAESQNPPTVAKKEPSTINKPTGK